MRKSIFLGFLMVFFYSCKGEKESNQKLSSPILSLIDQYEIPHDQIFRETKIGGHLA